MPMLIRFSIGNSLLLLAGALLLVALGVEGGKQWVIFGFALVASIAFVKVGFRWAIHGTGYWPRGRVGIFLTMVVVLLAPVVVVAILRAAPGFLKDFPQFWFPLPLPLPAR